MLKRIFFLSCIVSISLATTQAQITDASVSGIYNFNQKSSGFDVRAYIPLVTAVYLNPRISYFHPRNTLEELYAGVDLSVYVADFYGINPYIMAGGYYNSILNYEDFTKDNPASTLKQNSFTFEPGVGLLLFKGCVNPYIDVRYSTTRKEFTGAFGILLHFGNCFVKSCPAGGCSSFR